MRSLWAWQQHTLTSWKRRLQVNRVCSIALKFCGMWDLWNIPGSQLWSAGCTVQEIWAGYWYYWFGQDVNIIGL